MNASQKMIEERVKSRLKIYKIVIDDLLEEKDFNEFERVLAHIAYRAITSIYNMQHRYLVKKCRLVKLEKLKPGQDWIGR